MTRPSLLVISSLSIPTITILLTTYLYNHPLPASRSRQISKTDSICPSFASSNSLQKIINPNHHNAMEDSRSIRLLAKEIAGLSDEEILARFLMGFFGGWTFYPERGLIALLGRVGITFGTGFPQIPKDGPSISSFPLGLSRTSLPPKSARLFGGNFLVIDVDIKAQDKPTTVHVSEEQIEGSYIDIGFGDSRAGFAGVHRFEALREEGGVVLLYSHISCNPTVRDATFPKVVFDLHKFYALTLFRDGVAGVLRG